ncbi:putative alpha-amylase 3, chloroplastic [Cocos nucifera]|uniref:Putative alpha-amylase 3, chloroplastic n=1 Tax=Cocos nucifera TaxID=13894 RepID=A0A8K0N291_COCNU|nr:putative alpha-amylase 3, chloroplastic [Cocos nucifera]
MSIFRWRPVLHRPPGENPRFVSPRDVEMEAPSLDPLPQTLLPVFWRTFQDPIVGAGLDPTPSLANTAETEVLFLETFPLKRTETVEGRIMVRLDPKEGDGSRWRLVVVCNLEGKWVLHWGVTYCDELRSEWDQPLPEMIPPGSIPIKDHAIEKPLKKSSAALEMQILHEVLIDFDSNSPIAAIHFVIKVFGFK